MKGLQTKERSHSFLTYVSDVGAAPAKRIRNEYLSYVDR